MKTLNKENFAKFFNNIPHYINNVRNHFRNNRRTILYWISGLTAFGLFSIVLLVVLVKTGTFGTIPNEKELHLIENPVATEVYSSDSVLMGKYYVQNRLDLESNEITPIIENALISTEDIRFYKHNGIDYKSLARVFVKTIILGNNNSGGGSTITQQLVKNLYVRKNYKFGSIVINKIREMVIAKKLENIYSKEQILFLYLNTVPFGEQTYGIKAGSLRYFNKMPDQLSVEEAAMLVGMLKGPTFYSPRRNYDRALNRRNIVLSQMEKSGFLHETLKDSVVKTPIKLDYNLISYNTGIAPYFRAQIKKELADILRNKITNEGEPYDYKTDGLKVYTTIDSKMQLYAEQAVAEQMNSLQKIMNRQWKNVNWKRNSELHKLLTLKLKNIEKSKLDKKNEVSIFEWSGEKDTLLTAEEEIIHNLKMLNTGFMAMDVKTGEIKAWVGGINFKHFKYDHIVSTRQVGSTFKPFVYLAALEQGYQPDDVFLNDTITYEEYDNWRPQNANNKYGGLYTLKGALTHSVNTVSAGIIMKTGVKNVTTLAHNAGIQSKLPQVPSLALGTAELSLFEMIQAYQTIANKGSKVSPQFIKKIEDKDDRIIYQSSPITSKKKLAQKQNVEILVEILKNVVNKGTASSLRYRYNFSSEIAGKTGTTQNQADGWFIGFTPDIVAGAWVGASYPQVHLRSLKYGQGARSALPIWANFFTKVYNDKNFAKLKHSTFSIPDSIQAKILNCTDFIEEPVFEELESKPTIKIAQNLFAQ